MASHLQGRLDAFARVQAVVTRNPEGGVDLIALVEDELLAHAAREGENLKIEGPEIMLRPRVAETMSLAIHELTTNAVKYGALGANIGRIAIEWTREGVGAEERLNFAWTESGLDRTLEQPQRHGFGLELLQRTLPYDLRAETKVEFRPEGLRFTMAMPLGSDVLSEASPIG
jgi:two-component system CheB/CheR fusion protein